MTDPCRIAVLASGFGSNLQAILDAIQAGNLAAELAVVISNVASAHALERARQAGIPAVALTQKDRQGFEQALLQELKHHRIDLIVLAGFMKILSPHFVAQFPRKILNIHPALLPHFPGKDAILQAWQAGVAETGCTVHFVDEGVDTGPIIRQRKVMRNKDDTQETLTARIHQAEHQLYPEVIREIVRQMKKGGIS